MVWPFSKSGKKLRKNKEVETLEVEISKERTKLYGNLVRLEDATRSIETEGVRGMLGDMFLRLEEGRHRDK